MPSGEMTRVSERSGESDSTIDMEVGMGMIEMEGRIREGAIGMDHKMLEMDVRMVDWRIEKEEEEKGKVNWERVKDRLKDGE